MDAATLYMVLTLPNGEQKTSTVGEPTWQACWAHVEMLKDVKRTDPEAPIVSYRCELHNPIFGLIICDRRSGQCEHLRPSSRLGCTALQWVTYMRDRSRIARCFEHPQDKTYDRFKDGWSE
jgi:hypothetical protein